MVALCPGWSFRIKGWRICVPSWPSLPLPTEPDLCPSRSPCAGCPFLSHGVLWPLGLLLILADILSSQPPTRRKRKQKRTLMESLDNQEPDAAPEEDAPDNEQADPEAPTEEEPPAEEPPAAEDVIVTSDGSPSSSQQEVSHNNPATGPQSTKPPEESTADDESYANGLLVSDYSTGVSYARYVRPRVLQECTSMSSITDEIRGRDRLKRLVPTSFTYGGYLSRTGQTSRFSESMY